MQYNRLRLADCMEFMKKMPDRSVDFTLTDIPYDEVNAVRNSKRGIRILDKGIADVRTFALSDFLPEVYRVTSNNIIIFCSFGQFSIIYNYFKSREGTVRPLIWEKTNPMPLNTKLVYLSGVEFAVWFKKRGSKVFNAFCKNTVFRYPVGSSKIHPTEKHHGLLQELIEDNSNPGDVVFDPCAGSGAHLLVAKKLGRRYIGCEIIKPYFVAASRRLFA